ncbi:MAG: hypothetical protein ACKVX7_19010 [Planctomycetota bacterium]
MTSDWNLRRKQLLIEQILRLLNLAGKPDAQVADHREELVDDTEPDLEIDASACSRGATPLTRYSYYDNEGSGFCTDFPRWR